MIRCVLVDDDLPLCTLIGDYLRGFGMAVETLHTGAAWRQRLPRGGVDVLLLDLMLPDDDGLTLCQWSKRHVPALPILMLTAQGDPTSRVLGLEIGADDFIAKPFDPRELAARIKAVLRRGQGAAGVPVAAGSVTTLRTLRFEGWTFDRLRRQLVSPEGTLVALSAAEYRLLSTFVEHAGRVLSRERLLELSRATGAEVNDRSVDLAVSRLRIKLADGDRASPLIRTLRGEGYMFSATVDQ